ncbi:MAG: (2Fe-2S)-binding protein [Oscillospiraceae bacterium]
MKAADRGGNYVCDGVVLKEITTTKSDRTTVVTLEVPIAYVDEVRSVYRAHEYERPEWMKEREKMSERLDDDVLVCRCEEVTAGDIRRAIRAGATDVTQVKLRTRAGMGLCRGGPASCWCSRFSLRSWVSGRRRRGIPRPGRLSAP